jgi:hypothetical protein
VTVQQRTHPPSELADLCPQINLVRRQPWLAKNLKLPKTILSRRVWSCGTSENPLLRGVAPPIVPMPAT